jgi:Zn-dependent oligopeptidase
MAPTILELIRLRNKQANYLGYDNYFDMKLDLNEVNKEWLFNFFDSLEKDPRVKNARISSTTLLSPSIAGAKQSAELTFDFSPTPNENT